MQAWSSSLAVAVEEVIDGALDVMPDPSRDGIVFGNSEGRLSADIVADSGLFGFSDGALPLGIGAGRGHSLQPSSGDVKFLKGFSAAQLPGSPNVSSGNDHWRAILQSGRVVCVDSQPLKLGGLASVIAGMLALFYRPVA